MAIRAIRGLCGIGVLKAIWLDNTSMRLNAYDDAYIALYHPNQL